MSGGLCPIAWSILLQRPWVHTGLRTNGQATPWPCLRVSQSMGFCSLGELTCSAWPSRPGPLEVYLPMEEAAREGREGEGGPEDPGTPPVHLEAQPQVTGVTAPTRPVELSE